MSKVVRVSDLSSGIEHTGSRRTGGLSVTGGSDLAAYYISGEYQHEQGVVAINEQQKLNLRSNIRSQLRRSSARSSGSLSSKLCVYSTAHPAIA